MRVLLLFNILLIGTLVAVVTSDTEEGLSTNIELWELDFEDRCADQAKVKQDILSGISAAYETKLTSDKDYHKSIASITSMEDIRNEKILTAGYSASLTRKLKMFAAPGDIRLQKHDWDQFVTFTDENERRLSKSKCPKPNICYKDVQRFLAKERELIPIRTALDEWRNSPRNAEDFVQILPYIKQAAENNKFPTVEEYWEALVEKPNGYLKAKELWAEIEPFYIRLHQYTTQQLMNVYGESAFVNNTNVIPSYFLGSSNGLDWGIVADNILPHPQIYNAITESLKSQNLGGEKLYGLAQNMTIKMGLGGVNNIFWSSSRFNETCPAEVVEFCQKGNALIYTCNETGWSEFVDAHKTLMNINHQQLAAEDDLNTYILRYGNRQSAVSEAVQNLANLIAVDGHHLHNFGILPLKGYATSEHEHNNHMSLLLLTALRELPKLPYYLAADIWRMEVLKNHEPITKNNLIDWWKGMRFDFTKVLTYDEEFMDDLYILGNKPYLGKFFGTILQFQMLSKLKSNSKESRSLVSEISSDERLKNLMKSGMSKDWPSLINEHFGITEIDATDLLDYFRPLYRYMDNYPLRPKIVDEGDDIQAIIEKMPQNKSQDLEAEPTKAEERAKVEVETETETELPFPIDKDGGGGVTVWAITVVGLIIVIVVAFVVRRKIKERRERDNNKKYQV